MLNVHSECPSPGDHGPDDHACFCLTLTFTPLEPGPIRCNVCNVDSEGSTYLAFIHKHAGCTPGGVAHAV